MTFTNLQFLILTVMYFVCIWFMVMGYHLKATLSSEFEMLDRWDVESKSSDDRFNHDIEQVNSRNLSTIDRLDALSELYQKYSREIDIRTNSYSIFFEAR